MATTKIWDVSAHVSKLLAYVANKNKTTMEIESGFDDEEMRLAAEMLGLSSDHFATEEKKFVTGINCTPENANEVMLTLLEGISSSDIQAYHGYQSFKPGEVTPDVAHAIGVQLANELWGEDFPIIVAPISIEGTCIIIFAYRQRDFRESGITIARRVINLCAIPQIDFAGSMDYP